MNTENNVNVNETALAPVTTDPRPIASMIFDDGGFNLEADLTTRQTQYCSLKADSDEAKAKLFNAMNNPDKRIGDCINMKINAKDIYIEVVTCTNKETGEVNNCPRIVIIDDKGVSYQAVSIGIYSALKKVIQVFGAPTWEKAIPLEVKQVTKGERKMLTLNVTA